MESAGRAAITERRVTSVLFGDLVGFTPLSETLDPEDVRELLSGYFEIAREIITGYDGTVEKFIGDAVMSVWGAPVAHEDDAVRAVLAGMDLVAAVAAFGESNELPGLALRVGVVTGEVAATIGVADQGMVAGDPVNTAARVQTAAAPGEVWVDSQTRALSTAAIAYRDAGRHQLKGKAEPLQLFVAVGRLADGNVAHDRIRAAFFGRERELAHVKEELLSTVHDRRGRLVTISGAPGVGKTRLAREFEEYVEASPDPVRWHWGRCPSFGAAPPFAALSAAVRGRIGANAGATSVSTRELLAASLAQFVPDPAERAWLESRLAPLLGLDAPTYQRSELFAAWRTWFERMSGDEHVPVVWVIEDAHYADDGLLEFAHEAASLAVTPLLILILARPDLLERRENRFEADRSTSLGLLPLERATVAALLTDLISELPPSIKDALAEQADGNPLYAIETVRALVDQGLLVEEPSGRRRVAEAVSADQLGLISTPVSLQVLIASRLDLLSGTERATLTGASVMGQNFTVDGTTAVTGLPPVTVVMTLQSLISRDLIGIVQDHLSPDDGLYSFTQSTVRAVAYRIQSRRDRRTRHIAAADHLERLPHARTQAPAAIAQHLRDARALSRSADPHLTARLRGWVEHAADLAKALGAPADALELYLEALALSPPANLVDRLRLAAGGAANMVGNFDLAVEFGRAVMTSAGPDATRGRMLASLAAGRAGRRDVEWMLIEPFTSESTLVQLDPSSAAQAAHRIADYFYSNRIDQAEAWAARSLTLAERVGEPQLVAYALAVSSEVAAKFGHNSASFELFRRGADLARKHSLRRELSRLLISHTAYAYSVDLPSALSASDESRTITRQYGDLYHLGIWAGNRATALLLAGRWADMTDLDEPDVRRSLQGSPEHAMVIINRTLLAQACGQTIDLTEIRRLASDLHDPHAPDDLQAMTVWLPILCEYLSGNRRESAARAAAQVDALHAIVGPTEDFPRYWALAVEWSVSAGDYATARRLIRYASTTESSSPPPLVVAQGRRFWGTVEASDPASTARATEIETELRDGIEALSDFGARPDAARAQATLGVWLSRCGREDEATEVLEVARSTFQALKAYGWLVDLEAELAAVGGDAAGHHI